MGWGASPKVLFSLEVFCWVFCDDSPEESCPWPRTDMCGCGRWQKLSPLQQKKNKQTNIFPSHNFCLDCHCWCFHPLQISIIPPHLFTELLFAFKDSGEWGDGILSTSQLPTSDDLSEYRISCMQITHFLRLKPLKNPFWLRLLWAHCTGEWNQDSVTPSHKCTRFNIYKITWLLKCLNVIWCHFMLIYDWVLQYGT